VSLQLSQWHYEFSIEKACLKPQVYSSQESSVVTFVVAIVIGISLILVGSIYVLACMRPAPGLKQPSKI
jgi:hypothetical protein